MTTVQSLIRTDALWGSESILPSLFMIAVSICIFGGILRLLFGRGSSAVKAVSGCIQILFFTLITVILSVLIPEIRGLLPPLPFIDIHMDCVQLQQLSALTSDSLYSGFLRLFLLAFLVNLLEDILPSGKNFLSCLFLRLLSAAGLLVLY